MCDVHCFCRSLLKCAVVAEFKHLAERITKPSSVLTLLKSLPYVYMLLDLKPPFEFGKLDKELSFQKLAAIIKKDEAG